MEQELQITYRHMDPSEALDTKIRQRVAELDNMFDQITHCHVVVEPYNKQHQQGNLYQVSINLRVPGDELVVSREPGKNHAHEDAYVVVRDAFDALRRQLEDYVRKRKQHVKQHETPAHGRISELVPMQDYGRIQSSDGRDIYFHRNSVVDADFDKLEEGMEVRFSDEMGEEGPQASTVYVIGKHHVVG